MIGDASISIKGFRYRAELMAYASANSARQCWKYAMCFGEYVQNNTLVYNDGSMSCVVGCEIEAMAYLVELIVANRM